ncbi:hypothetical protein D3C71_840920 [compost metagenome]
MNNDQPRFSVLNIDTMITMIAASTGLRRVVDLPEFAQHAVTFESTRRDFTLIYHTMRDGKRMPAKLNLEQGEVLLINEIGKDALLSHDQPVKMFFRPLRPANIEAPEEGAAT